VRVEETSDHATKKRNKLKSFAPFLSTVDGLWVGSKKPGILASPIGSHTLDPRATVGHFIRLCDMVPALQLRVKSTYQRAVT